MALPGTTGGVRVGGRGGRAGPGMASKSREKETAGEETQPGEGTAGNNRGSTTTATGGVSREDNRGGPEGGGLSLFRLDVEVADDGHGVLRADRRGGRERR